MLMPQGVSVVAFMALMRNRAATGTPVPRMDETHAFLERCCAIGLLRRENVEGTTVYFPTQALAVLDTSD